MQGPVMLHGFFRSSASWRVRLALEIKGLRYSQKSYALRAGDQRQDAYLRLNPQGLVPALAIDGLVLTQSLAIIDYLEEKVPTPALLGADPTERARIRAFALAIACDIHPLQNLKVLKRIESMADTAAADWARDINREGLEACDAMLPDCAGPFCFGDKPTLADICLIPQMANARRFGVDIVWARLARIEAACRELPAFIAAAPEHQPDYTA